MAARRGEKRHRERSSDLPRSRKNSRGVAAACRGEHDDDDEAPREPARPVLHLAAPSLTTFSLSRADILARSGACASGFQALAHDRQRAQLSLSSIEFPASLRQIGAPARRSNSSEKTPVSSCARATGLLPSGSKGHGKKARDLPLTKRKTKLDLPVRSMTKSNERADKSIFRRKRTGTGKLNFGLFVLQAFVLQ